MDPATCQAFHEALQQAPTVYNTYQIEKITSDHFLKDLLPPKKCSLPYYLIAHSSAPESHVVKKLSSTDDSSEGSPLELQEFNMFTSESGSVAGSYLGLKCTDASLLLSMFAVAATLDEEEEGACSKVLLPLWVLCQREEGGMVAMGTDIQQRLDGSYSAEDMTVTLQGPFHKASSLPKLVDIKRLHSLVNGGDVSLKCFASYNVLGSVDNVEHDVSVFGGESSLVLQFEWTRCTALLQSPSPDAKCSICAVVGMGNLRSAARFLYEELRILQRLAHGLTHGDVQWSILNDAVESVNSQTTQLINTLIHGASGLSKQKATATKDEEEGSQLKNLLLMKRKNLDFTEQLWNIFKHCGSYQDLVDCLNAVFRALHSSQLKPMVHKWNKSTMAKLIRESFSKRMEMPDLTGLLPLQLLVEIGIGKLERDYMHMFLGKDLVTPSQLEAVLQQNQLPEEQQSIDTSSIPFPTTLASVNNLEKLHYVLELVVMLEDFLDLPYLWLSVAARKALEHVQEVASVDQSHKFVFNFNAAVSAGLIDSLIRNSNDTKNTAGLQPEVWTLHINSGGGHNSAINNSNKTNANITTVNINDSDLGTPQAVTVCHVTVDSCPLPHIAVGNDNNNSQMEEAVNYYLTMIKGNVLIM